MSRRRTHKLANGSDTRQVDVRRWAFGPWRVYARTVREAIALLLANVPAGGDAVAYSLAELPLSDEPVTVIDGRAAPGA